MPSTLVRWIPAAAAVAVIAVGAVAIPLTASASADLAPKSAEQVLAMIGSSTEDSFSGTVTTSTDLGLPALPTSTGTSGSAASGTDVSSLLSLLSTPQKVRIYVDGTSKARVQVLSNLAERDVIRNGADVWVWDSNNQTAVHTTLATPATKTLTATHSPAEIAKAIISTLTPSTTTKVGTASHVAGRSTYTLVLTPKATDTLVASVSISVDSQTGLPLAVSANARGQEDPAFRVAFSSLDLSTPSASLFDFTAPKGAKVTEKSAPQHSTVKAHPDSIKQGTVPGEKPTVVGSGWDAVVVTPANAKLAATLGSKQFSQLTTAVAGGRVAHTSLINVLVTTDGRIIAGSVPVARLEAVANAK